MTAFDPKRTFILSQKNRCLSQSSVFSKSLYSRVDIIEMLKFRFEGRQNDRSKLRDYILAAYFRQQAF
jgi:hypothetical protein